MAVPHCAGVAAVTGLLTGKLYDHQLHQAQHRYGLLRTHHEALQAQLAQLEVQLEDSDARRWVWAGWVQEEAEGVHTTG